MKFNIFLLASAATRAAASADDASRQHVLGSRPARTGIERDAFACDLPPPVLPPSDDGLLSADDLFGGPAALARQVHRLAAVVQVPSVSYDDMDDVDVDPRWFVFDDLHRVLAELFPAVHRRMDVIKVNTYGLVFRLNGTAPHLRPLMLTGHQDVVPVPDPESWTHPPFSGHYDGAWLWGRGAIDDKNSVVAVLSVLEALLEHDRVGSRGPWTPRRSIVVALGFDEESLGERGAGAINTYLEATYGRDSMALLLDEGGSGLDRVGDTLFALPAVAEKGQVNIDYALRVRGGHSSMPLPHTGIGIAAELVTALEAHPFAPHLISGSPLHRNYACRARYTPDADPEVTRLVRDNDLDALAQLLASYDPQLRFRLQTSQAVDTFHAGLKINALPELIEIGVNYRVAPDESLAAIKQRAVDLARPVADRYGIAIEAFGDTLAPRGRAAYDVNYNATLVLSAPLELPAAPVTPTTGAVWDLFSGTIQSTFASDGCRVVPVGDLMNGNTDTRSYLGLTRNVFRWVPLRLPWIQNLHARDEALHMDGHMEAVRFYYNLVRNFDAADV